MRRFSFTEKTFIVFVVVTIIYQINFIMACLLDLKRLQYFKFMLLYLLLFLISAILLFFDSKKTKKIAWIIALISSMLFLFNPVLDPVSKYYMSGSIMILVQSVLLKDIITALLQFNRSLIPMCISVCSVVELLKYKNAFFDKAIGILIIGCFIFSLFFERILLATSEVEQYIRILIFSLIFVVSVFMWAKYEKKHSDR